MNIEERPLTYNEHARFIVAYQELSAPIQEYMMDLANRFPPLIRFTPDTQEMEFIPDPRLEPLLAPLRELLAILQRDIPRSIRGGKINA